MVVTPGTALVVITSMTMTHSGPNDDNTERPACAPLAPRRTTPTTSRPWRACRSPSPTPR
jgi:hypothetical protein